MTPSQRRALPFALLIAAHPLFAVGWLVGLAEPAYFVEMLVGGVFAYRLRPWLLLPQPAREPARVLHTHDGFKTKLARPLLPAQTGGAVLAGAALSTLGWAMGMGAAVALFPARFALDSEPAATAAMAVALFSLLHLVGHLVGMSAVGFTLAWWRREHHAQLLGHVFRVEPRSVALHPDTRIELDPHAPSLTLDDGNGPVVAQDDPAVLAWLRDALEGARSRPRALDEKIPEALERLREVVRPS